MLLLHGCYSDAACICYEKLDLELMQLNVFPTVKLLFDSGSTLKVVLHNSLIGPTKVCLVGGLRNV